MAAKANFDRLLEQHRDLLRQFAITELDLAVTFCERAASAMQNDVPANSSQDESRRRNLDNAAKAYDSALRALQRSEEKIDTDPEIAERLRKAETLLATLGQS
jgi:hypothetical protein